MSAITPQTELRLLKCPIEEDNRNQINFTSKETQYNYFNSLPSLSVDNFTYQRKDGVIRYPEHIDNILEYNYVMYQNEAYTNKWFYAFITNMEYVNDKMTYITIKTDVFQTWQFDLIYKRSFIEREHVNDDTPGKHTIPEGLETGEYITRSSGVLDFKSPLTPVFDNNSWAVVMGVTLDNELFPDLGTVSYGGVFSGTVYIEFSGAYIGQAGAFIKAMNAQAKLEAITTIFMLPKITLDSEGYSFHVGSLLIQCGRIVSSYEADELTLPVGDKPTTIGSYTPKNKKLLTSDYCYLLMDNGVGGTKKYNFEDFADKGQGSYDINFDYISTPCPSGSVLIAPLNYKSVSQNLVESFAGAKFPMCSWASDPYTNWLTQSAVNRAFNYGTDALQTLTGLSIAGLGGLTGNPALMFYGGSQAVAGVSETIGDIKEDVKQRKMHKIAPNELSGNESLGDVAFAHFRSIPKYYYMSVKEEYAKIIDNYFSMFGYQVNEVKLPNITGRSNWNYVKTVNANIEGNVPEGDLQEIKNIFNNGVTFWHKTNYYLDYSQNNTIV